ncbi:MAG: rod shape-determining protein MreD [Bacteroidales bacterium]|nr:rod shape-determining protein MreD [Bacteroidales bacterium]MCF8337597.1 rod shape-determining protein MreD [Bacteroidales bacterium]
MYLKHIIRCLVLILLQVLILNQVNLNGYIDPYLYILFILLLPFETPRWLLLILAFITGSMIDIFSNTGGIHAAATTFMAFARPGVIRLISKKTEFDTGSEPCISDMGTKWFYLYSLYLVLLHHVVLFTLEIFRLNEPIELIYRIALSTLITLILILITQYLFPKRNKK